MDTEYEMHTFVYELDDGQIIEVYNGDALPFPLLATAENDVENSYRKTEEEEEVSDEYDLSVIESTLLEISDKLEVQNQNFTDGIALHSSLVGLLIGFLACKELLKIWLQ